MMVRVGRFSIAVGHIVYIDWCHEIDDRPGDCIMIALASGDKLYLHDADVVAFRAVARRLYGYSGE